MFSFIELLRCGTTPSMAAQQNMVNTTTTPITVAYKIKGKRLVK